MATARIRRKDLKKPDEFLTLTGQAITWIRAHKTAALWSGVAIAVVFAGVSIRIGYQAAQQREANEQLGRAMASMRANDFAEAATEFTEIGQRWNATGPGDLAGILAASTNLRLGNTDAALTAIEQAANAKDLSDYLHQQVLFMWGVALEQKGDLPGAAARYGNAAELSGAYTGQAILGEARVREQAGEAERARELYRKYYDQFPDAADRELIKSKAGITADTAPPAPVNQAAIEG